MGWENCFLPSCTGNAACLLWEQLPVADILSLGLLCNCTKRTQSWSAWGGGRCFTIHKVWRVISYLFHMGSLTRGKYISGDSYDLLPFSRKAHRKRQIGGRLHTVLHIIISRNDTSLLKCWIKEKPKPSFFFSLMQQCYKWKHVNEFPSWLGNKSIPVLEQWNVKYHSLSHTLGQLCVKVKFTRI